MTSSHHYLKLRNENLRIFICSVCIEEPDTRQQLQKDPYNLFEINDFDINRYPLCISDSNI